MSPAKVVVYTGPTISAAQVHAVLPAAQLRPPAARGDLLAERWSRGDVAVVIDGYFRERRSVGHKEILRLLADGVHVVGAASMGALRAAELAPCGMARGAARARRAEEAPAAFSAALESGLAPTCPARFEAVAG